MNTNELIESTAGATGLTKTDTKKTLDAAFAAIASNLAAGNEVAINNFGKFVVTSREAREGRNPATGETIQIAASKNVKFKAGKQLKDVL